MAQNNYFGFTHGGTQYGAAAYQTGQPGYAVTPAATAATYTQRPAAAPATGYESYQAAAAAAATGTTYAAANPGAVPQTYDYGYGRPAPAATYDATKTYYQQQAAPATYTTTETHYQAAKPAYSTTSAYTAAPRQPAAPAQPKSYQATSTAYPQPNPAQNATYSSGYTAPAAPAPAPTAGANKTPGTTYSGYDAALYSAATMYVAQQQRTNSNSNNQKAGGWQGYGNRKGFGAGGGGGGGAGGGGAGGGGMKAMRPKQPPKPQQLHYCDVCKISCAGPQTYREHLEGQKHKKKEASMKVPQQPPTRGAGNSLRCELCDVTCTGNDAYAAHIRGAKHQKVVKLHTKLGKPIPSADPTVLNPKANAGTKTATVKKTVAATPKINFIASGNLGTVASQEVKAEPEVAEEANDEAAAEEKDIQPVGQEYIEENKSEDGKIISFNCKLCECRFNDPNAKDMHMKGRRHRFAYKRKVDPDLVVDMKPSLKQRKMFEEKLRQQQMREEYMMRRREEMNQMGGMGGPMGPMMDDEMMYWEERRRYEEDFEYYEWYRRYGRGGPGVPPRPFPGPPHMMMFPGPQRRPDTSDDKHVIAHHSAIYPKEEELQSVQKIVSHTEKALKFVSDALAESTPNSNTNSVNSNSTNDNTKKEDTKPKATTPQKEEESDGNIFSFQKEKEDARILRGVMRVGNLAKGLLLSGDNHVCLVVLCAEKPTKTLLNKIVEILPAQLKIVAPDESYNVGKHPESAAITVSGGTVTVSVTLTSPLMRDTIKPAAADSAGQQQGAAQSQTATTTAAVTKSDPPDVLPKAKCLEALAALRHAKWFQARPTSLQSCVMVIRIMRDLCNRVPTWGPLNAWALELLAEKVISTAGGPLSPGAALRRLLECVAGGILLPGTPGLSDPCEKEPVDAIGNMTAQQREDITASAQHALRLVAFRQIHKVLGMEQLPPPKYKGHLTRKRRRDNSDGTDSEASKKDKKADEMKMETDSK